MHLELKTSEGYSPWGNQCKWRSKSTGTHFIWRWKLLLIILQGVLHSLIPKLLCQLFMATVMLCNTQLSEPQWHTTRSSYCSHIQADGSVDLGQSHSLLSADQDWLWPGSWGNSGLLHMPLIFQLDSPSLFSWLQQRYKKNTWTRLLEA